MALYEVWNPHLIAPRTLRVEVTEAEARFTAHGSDALIAAAAAALGVGEVGSWQRRVVRSQYFSWYRDEDEAWVDRWPLVWQLTLELREERAVAPIPRIGRFALDALGPSQPDEPPVGDADLPYVVIAAFRDRAAADAAVAPGMSVERGVAMGRFPSLAVEVAEADAEPMVARLADAGATINQRDTFLWFVGRAP
jgi:hypothetical protein